MYFQNLVIAKNGAGTWDIALNVDLG